jgi:hypothetical protein
MPVRECTEHLPVRLKSIDRAIAGQKYRGVHASKESERRFAAIEKEIPTVMKRDSGTARVTGYTQSAGDFT